MFAKDKDPVFKFHKELTTKNVILGVTVGDLTFGLSCAVETVLNEKNNYQSIEKFIKYL